MATAQLSGTLAADNAATVFLNSNALANNLALIDTVAAFQTTTAFSAMGVAGGILPGLNVLTFSVVDGLTGPPSPLLVTGLTGTAVAVPGAVAGAGLIPLLGLEGAWYAGRRKRLTT